MVNGLVQLSIVLHEGLPPNDKQASIHMQKSTFDDPYARIKQKSAFHYPYALEKTDIVGPCADKSSSAMTNKASDASAISREEMPTYLGAHSY